MASAGQMAHALCALIFVSLVISLASAQVLIGKVCTNSRYGGTCANIYSNSAITNFAGSSVGDNSLSSMQFTVAGYFVDIYDGASCTSTSKRYRTSVNVPTLGDESPSWNDRITSLRVTAVPTGTPGITFWKNVNRQGQSQYYGVGDYTNLSFTGFPNSEVSSVQQWEYTLAYIFQNTGGVTLCPTGSCAYYAVTTAAVGAIWSQLTPNDAGKSLYVAAYMTSTTTTAAATTTAMAATTNAVVSTTNAVVASTTTFAASTIHESVTTGLAAGGGMARRPEHGGGKQRKV